MAKTSKQPPSKSEALEEKERTTINLRSDVMKNMKFIALFDDKSITEVMESAMVDYINKWEGKHGALPKKSS